VKVYYPIDGRKPTLRAIKAIHPEAIVLVEAEIWPNFLWRAYKDDIPVFLVNARLSEKSYRGYQRFGFLFRHLFGGLTGVGCQNEADANRLHELGCRSRAIHVVGNLKYDAAKLSERRLLDVPTLFRQLGVPEGARVLVGGSTHAGEEAVLGEVFLRLRQRFPDLFLVLVPRHFERSREAGQDLSSRGVKFVYRSEVVVHSQYERGAVDCLLVNTTGELKYFYEHATVIFVGKSLTARGGQNPIEPAALGKAIVFGHNMQNFEAIAKAFVEQNGAIRVRDAAELETALGELIENEQRREELGKNALRVVKENVGAIERTVEMILKHLPSDEIYLTAPAEESNMDSSAQSTAQPLPLPSNRTTDHRAAEH
jgi:3-deoxy-D-manno-octulosonic-acid transferase